MQNDHLLEKIYAFEWYRMSSKQQKLIGAMIHSRQNAPVIRMGPLAVLNYETATDVITINS